jgi:alkyl sulfatase BDS1-like metallo-beta-lactamase superfamily hydrolase
VRHHLELLPILALFAFACAGGRPIEQTRVVPTTAMLDEQCRTAIGERRIEKFELGDGVSIHVAIGYDVANTILIHTPEGNVVVDAMTSPERASEAQTDLLAQAPGPTKALILTHSHIDHVGGAAVWAPLVTESAESPVPIWATEAFTARFFDQYGVFAEAEQRRGLRQFGARVDPRDLPCSALGARIDFSSGIGGGVRLPTERFSGQASFTVGGVVIELYEAHGETDDQLFVWLPQHRVLLPGDNIYRAFPNLYTIRGTHPRPVETWIASLDRMRLLEPALMIGSHTAPFVGAEHIAEVLRDYRDAIAFLRATVVRGANAGWTRAQIAESVTLPAELADKPWLLELYGQLDWSALSIYDAELGWFDGQPEQLYPVPNAELERHEIELMGGVAAVRTSASKSDDPRLRLHLLGKLRRSGLIGEDQRDEFEAEYIEAMRAVAEQVSNTNGRGYLLEHALELEAGPAEPIAPVLSDEFLREIPVVLFFEAMPTRLKLELAGEVDECLKLELTDTGSSLWISVRRGVVEVAWDRPFPGTPEPFATLTTDSLTWKRIALQLDTAGGAVTSGRLKIDGPLARVQAFFDRFDRGR